MRSFAINYNSNKNINEKMIQRIILSLFNCFSDCSVTIYKDSLGLRKEEINKYQLIIVLGGDGTILRTAGAICSYDIPILGINTGNLGFLSSAESKDLEVVILKISEGKFYIEKRFMLKCNIGEEKTEYFCLNDIVVSKSTVPGVTDYQIYIDNNFYTRVKGDGIIVSTPTGSTAYNISAGGPVIYPTLEVMSITPICSHYLGVRPIILDSTAKIEIRVKESNEKVYLIVDGNVITEIEKNKKVYIEKAEFYCKLIRFESNNYYDILKSKILGRNIEGEFYENRTS